MIGKTVSHYNILEKLGEGGMGVVYKARDMNLDRLVAIKFLPASLTTDDQLLQQFVHEARAVSTLEHPNICPIYEFDKTEDEQMYMVMAYCSGQTLHDHIVGATVTVAPLPIIDCINIAIQIARGLEKAHKKGIIHRDIKPGNIIISEEGEVKILDFGLAKLRGDKFDTDELSTIGTVAYMSPEQVMNESVDQRSDIWSLGVVMYEMLSEELPFQAAYDQTVVYSILKEDLRPLSSLRKDIPERLEKIVYKALEKDPDKRYQNAGDMLNDLESLKIVEPVQELITQRASKENFYKNKKFVFSSVTILCLVGIMLYIYLPDSPRIEKRKNKVIAVLPFDNLSSDPESEIYCEGITEDIRARLSKISGIRVLARASVLQYRDAKTNLQDIARELNAEVLMDGSVRIHENRIRVIAKLFEGKTTNRLWTESYDRELFDIFQIQSDIARQVGQALEFILINSETERIMKTPTGDISAYDYYLKGREYAAKSGKVYQQYAVTYLKKAINLDPNFALAYVGLSSTYFQLVAGLDYPITWIDSSKALSLKAIRLDPTCSEAYCSLGRLYEQHYYSSSYDNVKAIELYQKAIDLNPSNWLAYYHMGRLKKRLGEYHLALDYLKKSLQLNPLSEDSYVIIVNIFNILGEYDAAIEEYEKALEVTPSLEKGGLSFYYLQQEMYEPAIKSYKELLEKNPNSHWLHHDLACIHKNFAQFDQAIEEFDKALELSPGQRWHYIGKANVYVEQGQYDDALTIYQKAQIKFRFSISFMLNYSFLLTRMSQFHQAQLILDDLLQSDSIEYDGLDKCIIQIIQFYLGLINENDIKNALNNVSGKLQRKSYLISLYYYLGMAYLLNLNQDLKDEAKAIEFLQKYVSQAQKDDVEYSLARAELNKIKD